MKRLIIRAGEILAGDSLVVGGPTGLTSKGYLLRDLGDAVRVFATRTGPKNTTIWLDTPSKKQLIFDPLDDIEIIRVDEEIEDEVKSGWAGKLNTLGPDLRKQGAKEMLDMLIEEGVLVRNDDDQVFDMGKHWWTYASFERAMKERDLL